MRLNSVDIHSHLLPGVDDGFQNSPDSLQAIRCMAGAGCHKIVLTPHINPELFPQMDEQSHSEVFSRFREQIPEQWNVDVHLAAEYMIVNDFHLRVSQAADTLAVFPDRSILVEMSYSFRSKNLEQTLFELNMAGFRPILAHPERYLYMADCLSDFDRIAEMGCRFQLNMISATGKYGPESVKIMNYLLKRGLYSFMATDLHSLPQLDKIMKFKPGLFLKGRLAGVSE